MKYSIKQLVGQGRRREDRLTILARKPTPRPKFPSYIGDALYVLIGFTAASGLWWLFVAVANRAVL